MPPKVLAVEDNARLLNQTLEILKKLGCDARGLTDPRDLIDLLHTFQPEVCIVDIEIPSMCVPDLLGRIKAIAQNTEVILLTGAHKTAMATEFLKQGAADYLTKPVEAGQVELVVKRVLEQRIEKASAGCPRNSEMPVEAKSPALSDALRDLNELYSSTLETLVSAIDARDQEISGHSRRVADMTVKVAKKLGLNGGELKQIEHGALLHDIGKLRIPDSILRKPSALTPEEWEVMRKHPEFGFEIVQKLGFMKGAADIILSHHEKFDGTGYPRGLKGKEISLAVRIFTLVDAVDALVYDRPYRRGADFAVVREEITKRSGTYFDPDLLEAVLDCLSENFPPLAAENEVDGGPASSWGDSPGRS